MSIPERVFRISKAYLHQVRDRIDSELSDAEHELDASNSGRGGIDSPTEARSSAYQGSDPEAMMRRAEERIAAARRDLESRGEMPRAARSDSAPSALAAAIPSIPATTTSETILPSVSPKKNNGGSSGTGSEGDPNYHDYRVLGVPVGGDLAQVQSEYEKLSRRLDPTRLNFPEGSTEQKQAEQILVRINNAYEALRHRLDPTENRFGKLELE